MNEYEINTLPYGYNSIEVCYTEKDHEDTKDQKRP